MDIENFHQYWSTVNAAETLQLHGLIRYVQSRPLAGAYRSCRSPPCDGIASMWFASMDEINNTLNSKQYIDIVEGEGKFIDSGTRQTFITTEHIVIQ